MRFNASWQKRTALGFFWLALAGFLVTTEIQAQLYIDVYPSQDNPTSQTIWIFRSPENNGNTPFYGSAIRSVGANNFHRRDSWKIRPSSTALYSANKPTNRVFNLTPLFGSTNTMDIDSITRRLPGAPPFGPFSENTVLFANANVTNTPTMAAIY